MVWYRSDLFWFSISRWNNSFTTVKWIHIILKHRNSVHSCVHFCNLSSWCKKNNKHMNITSVYAKVVIRHMNTAKTNAGPLKGPMISQFSRRNWIDSLTSWVCGDTEMATWRHVSLCEQVLGCKMRYDWSISWGHFARLIDKTLP